MGNSDDSQRVQPRNQQHITAIVNDDITVVAVGGETPVLTLSGGAYRLYMHCRDVSKDAPGIRIVAASALVVGLLLSTAPAAFAQVGRFFTAIPSAAAQATSTQDSSRQDNAPQGEFTDGEPTIDAQGYSNAQHQSITRSAAALIRWTGTGRALKCSYGLLIEGNTRICETT